MKKILLYGVALLLSLGYSADIAAETWTGEGQEELYAPPINGVNTNDSNPWGESNTKLEVYEHFDAAIDYPTPVLIEIHGGGWCGGNKGDFGEYLQNADGDGIIEKVYQDPDLNMTVVSINYPLAEKPYLDDDNEVPNPLFWDADLNNNKIFPRGAEYTQKAIQYVRSRAAAWNIDPERVYAIGGSAGGNLALWSAMKNDARDPLAQAGMPEAESSRLDGVIAKATPSFNTPTTLSAIDMKRSSQLYYFGYTDAQLFTDDYNVGDPALEALVNESSPGWVVLNGGDSPAESAALASENATVPILGLYGVQEQYMGNAPTQSFVPSPLIGYQIPNPNPHGHIQGLMMQDAYQVDDLTPYHVDYSLPSEWEDFSFSLHREGSTLDPLTPAEKEAAANDVISWLEARVTRPIAKLAPDAGAVPASTYIGYHLNLGNVNAQTFYANMSPTGNGFFIGLYDGDTGDRTLVIYPKTSLFDDLFSVSAQGNTIDITSRKTLQWFLNQGVGSLGSFCMLGVNNVATELQVGTYSIEGGAP